MISPVAVNFIKGAPAALQNVAKLSRIRGHCSPTTLAQRRAAPFSTPSCMQGRNRKDSESDDNGTAKFTIKTDLEAGNADPNRATAPRKPRKSKLKPEEEIKHGSEHHNDLPSFLEYTSRNGVDEASTVFRGTHYEYVVVTALQRLGFTLQRVGAKSDLGIDLIGRWQNPALQESMRIYVQCKALNKKSLPETVRGLEGSSSGIPADWHKEDILGLLVTQHQATKGVIEAIARSRVPLGFLKVTAEGQVEQFLWNHSATERGLQELGVTLRFNNGSTSSNAEANIPLRSEIILTWKGRPVADRKAQKGSKSSETIK